MLADGAELISSINLYMVSSLLAVFSGSLLFLLYPLFDHCHWDSVGMARVLLW